jgi:hypothetical protein
MSPLHRCLALSVVSLAVLGAVPLFGPALGFACAAASPVPSVASRPFVFLVSNDTQSLEAIKDDLLTIETDPPPGFTIVERRDLRTDERNQGTGLFDRVEYRLSGNGGQGAIEFRIYNDWKAAEADYRRLGGAKGARLFGDEQAPAEFNARYLHGSRMFTVDDPEFGEMDVPGECALTLLPGKGLITRCAALESELPVIAVVRRVDPEPATFRESDFDTHVARVAPVVDWSLELLLWIGW